MILDDRWHHWLVGLLLAPFVFIGCVSFMFYKHGLEGVKVYLRVLRGKFFGDSSD